MKNLLLLTILVGAIIIISQPLAFGYYPQTHHTTLTLKPIPSSVQEGNKIIFAGTLLTSDDKTPLANKTVYIQYDSPYEWTRTIASATTDNNGNYEIIWIAKPKLSSACTYNIFAIFHGDDDNYYSVSNQFRLYVATNS